MLSAKGRFVLVLSVMFIAYALILVSFARSAKDFVPNVKAYFKYQNQIH